MLTLIGREVGANWEDWKDKLHYVDYAVAVLIVLAVAYFLIRYWRRRRPGGPSDEAPAVQASARSGE
jgi:membrane protein DedA with SNARE-associated domain